MELRHDEYNDLSRCILQVPLAKLLPMNRNYPTQLTQLAVCLGAVWSLAVTERCDVLADSVQGYEQVIPAMGTTVTLAAFSSQSSIVERAFAEARSEITRLVTVLSDYDDESELSQLNRTMAQGSPIRVSAELWTVLEASDRWHQVTSGALDPSVGMLTRLWRQHRRKGTLPSDAAIADALASSGWRHLRLNANDRSVACNRTGVSLDLGAIAKGYIVDRAFDILQQHGLKSCMVNAGGDLRCGDAPPNRSGWRIGIASFSKDGPPMRILQVANAAIATSGDLWQYTIVQGRRRSHILDPKSGIGVEGPMSFSAIASTAMDADAAATALSVLGVQVGCELAERLPEIEAMAIFLVEPQNAIRYTATSGFAR